MRDTDTSFLMDHFLTDQFLTIKIFLFRILYLDLYKKKKKTGLNLRIVFYIAKPGWSF